MVLLLALVVIAVGAALSAVVVTIRDTPRRVRTIWSYDTRTPSL
ncbi:hypothetical protein [Microbacterium yannicii]|nr:hypothetical protein [Microbacterium yannicii]